LRVVEQGVDSLASPALECPAALRAARVDPQAPKTLGVLAVGGVHRERLAVRRRPLHHHDPRADELAQTGRRELEQLIQIALAEERLRDLVQRLELPRPLPRRFVEPRVLDRDGRLRREQADDFLVLLAEVVAALLLRQVEVAERRAADADRRAEEAL